MAQASNGTAEAERINHSAHYQLGGGVEVIDIAERLPFNRGNAVKYLCRAGNKPTAEELDDLCKARWYVDREIQLVRTKAAEVAEQVKEKNAKGAAYAKTWAEAEAASRVRGGILTLDDLPDAAASPAPVPEQAAEAAEQPAESGLTREGAVEIGEAFADLCSVPERDRYYLVDKFSKMDLRLRPTWKGKPVSIAGNKNPFYATLTTSAPGFYGVAWHDVGEVFQGRKTFDQCNIWLVSNAWLGSEGGNA